MITAIPKYTSTLKRMPASSGMLQDCVQTKINGLDFNGYLEDCKSENTRANHPYKMQTKSAKVISLKYSFFVKIIKDQNNLPDHLFADEIRLSNFLSAQNGDIFQSPTNHRSADQVSHLAGLGFFSPRKFEIRKALKSYFQCFERTILFNAL